MTAHDYLSLSKESAIYIYVQTLKKLQTITFFVPLTGFQPVTNAVEKRCSNAVELQGHIYLSKYPQQDSNL